MAEGSIRRSDYARLVEEYRKKRGDRAGERDASVRRSLSALGVQHSEVMLVDVQRRAAMSDKAYAVRETLDHVADRARSDEAFRQRLLTDAGAVLAEAGLSSADAGQVLAEMDGIGPGEGHTSLRCSFTCCRHPATEASCDYSVLV